jgi:tetratricopeptide (TPR) repeat protein
VASLLSAALCGSQTALIAQDASTCKGSEAIEQAIASQPSAAAYDSLGAYFAKQNQFTCAIAEFELALQLDPASWESHYDLGITFLANGHPEDAVHELQNAATLNPEKAKIHIGLAMAFNQMHKSDEAIDEYKTVLKTDPQSIPALNALSKTLIEEKRYTAAIESLKESGPDEGLQLNLATAYARNGNPQRAIQILTLIVNANPVNLQAHLNLGLVYQQKNQYSEAAREFQQALHLDPADDFACISYLNMLVVLTQYTAAQPVIQEYLRRQPHNFSALYLAGVVERGLGDYGAAMPHLQQAVALKPLSYEAHYNLGFVLARLGEPAQARKQMELALQLRPQSGEAHFQLANLLRALGQQEKAQMEFAIFQREKEEATRQNIASTKADLGNRALQAVDTQKAIDLYRESITEYPSNFHVYYNLALALNKQRDYRAESDALDQAIKLNADYAPAHNQLGFLKMQSGDIADAEAQFKIAISIDPQYAEAENNLGVLYGQLGRRMESQQLFLRATENNPQYVQAFVNLGLVLASESRFADAERALRSAIQLDPHDPAALTAQMMVQKHLN